MTSNPVTGTKRAKALERMSSNSATRVRSAEGQWHIKTGQGRFRAAVQVVRDARVQREEGSNDRR